MEVLKLLSQSDFTKEWVLNIFLFLVFVWLKVLNYLRHYLNKSIRSFLISIRRLQAPSRTGRSAEVLWKASITYLSTWLHNRVGRKPVKKDRPTTLIGTCVTDITSSFLETEVKLRNSKSPQHGLNHM